MLPSFPLINSSPFPEAEGGSHLGTGTRMSLCSGVTAGPQFIYEVHLKKKYVQDGPKGVEIGSWGAKTS